MLSLAVQPYFNDEVGKLAFMGAPTDYAKRVKAAMDARAPPATIKTLAEACCISVQAVGQLLNGASKAFAVEAHARAARFLGVDPFWLATGEGEMHSVQAPGAVEAARELLQFAAKLNKSPTGSPGVVHLEDIKPARGRRVKGNLAGEHPLRRKTDKPAREK